jgi:hypothetical protein
MSFFDQVKTDFANLKEEVKHSILLNGLLHQFESLLVTLLHIGTPSVVSAINNIIEKNTQAPITAPVETAADAGLQLTSDAAAAELQKLAADGTTGNPAQ